MKVSIGKPKVPRLRWYHRLLGIEPKQRKDRIKIRIDNWDTWNVDYTLSRIAVPLLREYKEKNNGFPVDVDEVDIPNHIKNSYDSGDERQEAGWDAIVDKMIRAHEMIVNDEIMDTLMEEGEEAANNKAQVVKEGLSLFGKYYQNLWW